MVAENKISPRQLRRMLFIEMFGAGALSVPALACYNGQPGGVAVLFYGILQQLYFTFSLKKYRSSFLKMQKVMQRSFQNQYRVSILFDSL